MTDVELAKALLTAPAGAPPKDMGPEARRASSGGMRPAPKSDQELGIDEGPKFSREYPQFGSKLRPVLGEVTGGIVPRAQDAPGTQAYASHHAGDEMNDPGAQMLTGGAMAAPGAALVGAAAPAALSPMLSGAAAGGQQAAMMGQDVGTGMVLGALPGAPRAALAGVNAAGELAQAAENAVGQAALERAIAPGFGKGPGPVARGVGSAVGTAVGHSVGGLPGAVIGAGVGHAVPGAISKLGQKLTSALASRHLARLAPSMATADTVAAPPPSMGEPQGPPPDAAFPPGYARGPNGPIGPNEFDEGVGDTPPASNHATVGGATAITPIGQHVLTKLRAEGDAVLAQLSKMHAAGVTEAPPALVQRAQDIMRQLETMERVTGGKPHKLDTLIDAAQSGNHEVGKAEMHRHLFGSK